MFNEKLFWEKYWQSRIDFYKRFGVLFEEKFRWGYYCNKALYQHYKDIIGDIRTKNILELGAGSGYVSCLAARDGANVTAVDYAKKAIEYIHIVSGVLGVQSEIKIILGDLDSITLYDHFDAVWNCGVLEHYSDEKIISRLRLMSKLTKTKGVIICTIPNLKSPEGLYRRLKNLIKKEERHERLLNFQSWIMLFRRAGFKQIEIVPVNYFIPSFIPGELAYLTSQHFPLTRKLIKLAWLFSIVGIVEK